MTARTRIDRFGLVANVVAIAVSGYFLARGDSGTRLGPARTDDLPYGDLVTLDRNGALLWLLAGALGVLSAIVTARALQVLAAGSWFALAVLGATVVVTEADALGMSRPGDIAVCLGLSLSALLNRGSTPRAVQPLR